MKRSIFGLITMLAFFAFSCQNAETNKETEQTEEQTEQTADVQSNECKDHVSTCNGTLTVDQVLSDYEALAEKEEITVCGKVTHTCVHSGKRMFLAAENSEDILVVTTDDKFDGELVGQKVVVTGKIAMTVVEHNHAEGEEHNHDEQHEKAHEKTYVLESSSCKVCTCKHSEETAE